MNNINTIPSAARWLGFGGLLPFAATASLALYPALSLNDIATRALLAYGAVILSFLGGVRWGLAIVDKQDAKLLAPLTASVFPALIGWSALLTSTKVGLIILAIAFVLMLVADLKLSSAPSWYRTLRVPLTVGAVAALLLGLMN